MNIEEHIEVNPKVMMGRPVIKGTRIAVELILEKPAAGELVAHILLVHPHLTEESIKAALLFDAQSLKGEAIYPVAV